MAQFINDICLALEQTSNIDNQKRMQAEQYISEVSIWNICFSVGNLGILIYIFDPLRQK